MQESLGSARLQTLTPHPGGGLQRPRPPGSSERPQVGQQRARVSGALGPDLLARTALWQAQALPGWVGGHAVLGTP